ncbi:hypothetical protein COLO4_32701 [Corchorus olitorius]|uniref:Uncharacterized protein n=1 Tax=Corchorus olitorius TaxID=93759 RepID=A0A1R3GYR8_9ROSI|nr:hypothetical protein COLO4_32701 [Corchorus olitorius]
MNQQPPWLRWLDFFVLILSQPQMNQKPQAFKDFDGDPSFECSNSGDSTVGMASNFEVLFRFLPSIDLSVQF